MSKPYKALDFGCGKDKVQGSVGVDCVALDGVDIVHDMKKLPYPFESNSIDKIYCKHVLEHFDADVRKSILEEIHRILKNGGQLEIRVPHVFSPGAFHDPTHKSFFTFNTMDYFTKGYKFSYYSNAKFKIIERWANIQLFYDLSNKESKLVHFLNSFSANIFNKIFTFSNSLPDYLTKILPFYVVEIKWVLRKEDMREEPKEIN